MNFNHESGKGFGGDILFKCTGNACSAKRLSMVDTFEDSKPKSRWKPYLTVIKGQPKGCIFDRKNNHFITNGEEKSPIFSLSGTAIKLAKFGITKKDGEPIVLSDTAVKKYLSKCGDVLIAKRPFEPRGFKANDDEFATKIYNDIPAPQFNAVPQDATPVVREAISIFDSDLKIAGHSVFLIMLSAQLFGDKPIMASPALVGAPKTAKTFYAHTIIREYWGKELVALIDPMIGAAGWGGIEAGKRHVCYNDLDKMPQHIHSKLVGKIKREATEGDEGYHNMKGGAIKSATASNRSMTSNYVESVPLDAEGDDRRIYIPTVDFETLDRDKMAKAFDPKIAGEKVATQNRHDLINHLYQIWTEVKALKGDDSDALNKALFVEVPTTKEKK